MRNDSLLFPLDGGRGFGTDVVGHAVHAFDFVDDFIGHLGQEIVGQMGPIGGHGIGGGDSPEHHGLFVGALVAHHADRLHGQQNDAGLPYLVVEAPVAQALDKDVVGFLQDADFFGGDVAQYSHPQARTREGMTADQVLGHAQLAAHTAYLVLEEPLERFA